MTSPETLEAWLEYQQRQHPQTIAMGLDRVRGVWQALGVPRPAPCVITVAGTNGKGSTVAMLESMLRARGLRVGAYTSPHLFRYNERVRIDGRMAGDRVLCDAFARIERARGATPLTYFEFGTLAALLLFADARLDVALLEVGLGGRLDAVNIVDADVAIVTSIGIDHVEYLGPDLDSIGREKAGIARAGRPLVAGMAGVPRGLVDAVRSTGALLVRPGRDYRVVPMADGEGWRWSALSVAGAPGCRPADSGSAVEFQRLALEAPHQVDNAAAALETLWLLRDRLGWDAAAYAHGLGEVRLAGRLQHCGGSPALVLDVAHNPQAAAELAAWIDARPAVVTHAVFSALADKDIPGIVSMLGARIAHWHVGGIHDAGARGLDADEVARRLHLALPDAVVTRYGDLMTALLAARAATPPQGRILAFGSFHVIGALSCE